MNIEKEKEKENQNQNKSIEIYLKKKTGKISPIIYIEYPKTEEIFPFVEIRFRKFKNFLNKIWKNYIFGNLSSYSFSSI